MGDWREELRARGYRLTPQRELILGAVERLGHATPDEIFACVSAESSAINISTVYRTLEVLESLGLVRHLHLSDRAPTYHSVTTGPVHFHLSCRNCQQVISVDEERAAEFVGSLREGFGFEADVAHLTIFGIHTPTCPEESTHEHAHHH
ncbi:Fur family transcriptional regulator [Nocardioides sp. Kera G14]|uniref:Fur family transcriptional regulator n=1 Tax=Nocardioides sp. Kera G14 TaxID=2884264 RepID=UPI001D1268B9|nr:Fur family transcriptional regulator [Nocardioides sp. Kera G14]UDY23133.1 transcriptional repressor [Nocardioides sp. Kera G14]